MPVGAFSLEKHYFAGKYLNKQAIIRNNIEINPIGVHHIYIFRLATGAGFGITFEGTVTSSIYSGFQSSVEILIFVNKYRNVITQM